VNKQTHAEAKKCERKGRSYAQTKRAFRNNKNNEGGEKCIGKTGNRMIAEGVAGYVTTTHPSRNVSWHFQGGWFMEKRAGEATPIPSAYLNHSIFVVKTVLSTFAVNNAFPCIIHTQTHARTAAHKQKTAVAITFPSGFAFRTYTMIWKFDHGNWGTAIRDPETTQYQLQWESR